MVNLTQRQKTLPTMYDLPSEEVGEPGLPDQFHLIQAELLEQTFQPQLIPPVGWDSAAERSSGYPSTIESH